MRGRASEKHPVVRLPGADRDLLSPVVSLLRGTLVEDFLVAVGLRVADEVAVVEAPCSQ